MRSLLLAVHAAVVLGGLVAWATDRPDVPAMATFNIENFPRDPDQPAAAARVIGDLGVPVVAVQEIRSPARLLAAIHDELGLHWLYVTHSGGSHRVGLLVDRRTYRVERVRVHDEVRVVAGLRPALEVVLRHRLGLRRQSVFVVHLKSGPGGEAVRLAQLRALERIVADVEGPVSVVGDFNPVSERDRQSLRDFAAATGLGWRSADLACTAYFPDRDRCRGVALDHVMSTAPGTARALGACAIVGCEPGDRCPTWVREVSDHCPVRFSPRRPRSPPRAGSRR